MSIQLLKDKGINIPDRLIRFYNKPSQVLINNEQQLGELLAYGYELRDRLDIVGLSKAEKLAVQKSLNDISKRIISVYQVCLKNDSLEAEVGANMVGIFIIHMMSPVLYKYLQMLSGGLVDIGNRDTRRFLSLYAPAKNLDLKTRICKNYKRAYIQDQEVYNFFIEKTNFIRKRLEFISLEEKWNTLVTIMLECAGTFRTNTEVAFWYYVVGGNGKFGGVYKGKIKNWISRSCGSSWSIAEPDHKELAYNTPEDAIFSTGSEELDADWITGKAYSAMYGDVFVKLTQLQRQILVLKYQEGKGVAKISKEIGLNKNQCKRELQQARKIIEDELAGLYK